MNKKIRRIALCFLLSISAPFSLAAGVRGYQGTTGSPTDVVYEAAGNGIAPPRGIYTPEPGYTDRARKKRIKGTVVISLVVTPEGTVRDAQVVASLDKDLDRQAIHAVKAWKFKAASKNGTPVAFRLRTNVNFNLF